METPEPPKAFQYMGAYVAIVVRRDDGVTRVLHRTYDRRAKAGVAKVAHMDPLVGNGLAVLDHHLFLPAPSL